MATRPTAFSSILLNGNLLSGTSDGNSLFLGGNQILPQGEYVDLSSNQTIGGNKEFTNKITAPEIEAAGGWKFDLNNGQISNSFSLVLDLNNQYMMDPNADAIAFDWSDGGLLLRDAQAGEIAMDFSNGARTVYDAVQVAGQPSLSADFKERYFQSTGNAVLSYSLGVEIYNNSNIGGISALIGYCDDGVTVLNQLFSHPNENLSIDWNERGLYLNETIQTLGWASCILQDTAGIPSVYWENRTMWDASEQMSIHYGLRTLNDSAGVESLNWGSQKLSNTAGQTTLDWQNCVLYTGTSFASLDWAAKELYNSNLVNVLDWGSQYLSDADTDLSLNWTKRALYNNLGSVTLNWQSGILSGQWKTNTVPTAVGDIVNYGYLSGQNYQKANLVQNRQTATYTGQLTDCGNYVEISGNAPNNFVLTNLAWPSGSQIVFTQYGTGITTITGINGVVLRSRNNAYRMAGQFAVCTIINRGTGEFVLAGDLQV